MLLYALALACRITFEFHMLPPDRDGFMAHMTSTLGYNFYRAKDLYLRYYKGPYYQAETTATSAQGSPSSR